jgi:hypothetical protein
MNAERGDRAAGCRKGKGTAKQYAVPFPFAYWNLPRGPGIALSRFECIALEPPTGSRSALLNSDRGTSSASRLHRRCALLISRGLQ